MDGETATSGVAQPRADGWPDPNIPALDANVFPRSILNLMLGMTFGLAPVVSQHRLGHRFFLNLVRLVDKAANEYLAAKEAADDFRDHWSQGRFSPYFRATDHIESCVNALHRALLHADKIRSHQDLPQVDRTIWRSLRDAQRRLNDVRDAVEHTEEMLLDGRLPEDGEAFLTLRANDFTLAGTAVTYSELRAWITDLYQIMESLRNKA